MDIILLPSKAHDGYRGDEARLAAAAALAQQLHEAGEPVRLFAYLPEAALEGQNALIRFLIETSRKQGTFTALIIARSLLLNGILNHPYLRAIGQIIVNIDSAHALRDEEVAALGAYRQATSAYQQQPVLWLNGARSGRPNALGSLFRVAKIDAELALPPLQIGAPELAPLGAMEEIPEQMIATLPGCRLYESALTIDPAGRVIACGRHHDAPEHPDLGVLPRDALESIALKKGQLSIGTLLRCRTCRLSSRLLWRDTRGDYTRQLMGAGRTVDPEGVGDKPLDWRLATEGDATVLGDASFDWMLVEFERRLRDWMGRPDNATATPQPPLVSVETPVIKAGWLVPCIESVLSQTSNRWQLSLLWDAGDERSRRILEVVERVGHPRLSVHFGVGLGVARARKYLTERSCADYILPLDDDDLLKPETIERFLETTESRPWSGIIRARRDFVDEFGNRVEMDDWFPFQARQYHRGMICDLYNQSQPYLIARSSYDRTPGWDGFPEYRFAGEDCDIFTKIEEVAEIELLDDVLYSYRLSNLRSSHQLGTAGAQDMWRRLARATLARRDIPLALDSDEQPFVFSPARRAPADRGTDVVVLLPATATADTDAEAIRLRWSAGLGLDPALIHVLAPKRCHPRSIADLLSQSCASQVCLVRGDPPDNGRDVLARLVARMQAHDADLIGPKATGRDGRLLVADPHFGSDLMPATAGSGAVDGGGYDEVVPAPWMPAYTLLVGRHVFLSIHGPDQDFSGHLQDADFCLRARRRGFRCFYAGDVTAVGGARDEAAAPIEMRRHFLERWSRFPELVFPAEAETLPQFERLG